MKKPPPVEETLAELQRLLKENYAAMSELEKFSVSLMASRKETLRRQAAEVKEMRRIIMRFRTGR